MRFSSKTIGCFLLLLISSEFIRACTLFIAPKDSVNVYCFGDSSGVASCVTAGGTAPFTFSWSNGATTRFASGLKAGTYTVDVIDADSCTGTTVVTITEPSNPLQYGIAQINNVNCYGQSTGSIGVSAYGGTSPYTYLWDPGGETKSVVKNLSAGTYTLTIADNNGCILTASITITQMPPMLITVSSLINVSCYGNSTGSITINPVSGGTPPYLFSWMPVGGNNLTASNLSAGTYTVLVHDGKGCDTTSAIAVTQPFPLSVLCSVSNMACSTNNFTVHSNLNGGTSPFTYSWSNNQTAANVTGLSSGTYSVNVTDSCGDTASASITFTQPAPLIVVSDSVNATDSCNGIAYVMSGGGMLPYTYLWKTGQTTDSIKGACKGIYCCTITDNYGCKDSVCITIKELAGINEVSDKSAIKVVPDPTNGKFSIMGVENGMSIELYDYIGRKITGIQVENSTENFDLSGKPDGVYFIRVLNKNGTTLLQCKMVKTE